MGNHRMMTQTRALGGDTPFAARPPTDQLPAYSSRPPSTMTTGGNSHHRGESHPENRLSRPPPALTAGYHRRERSHPPNSSYQPNHWGGESFANCPLVQGVRSHLESLNGLQILLFIVHYQLICQYCIRSRDSTYAWSHSFFSILLYSLLILVIER